MGETTVVRRCEKHQRGEKREDRSWGGKTGQRSWQVERDGC